MKLLELRQLPKKSDVRGLYDFLMSNGPWERYIDYRIPFNVWTRGDGYRYKDPPYLKFESSKDADRAWEIFNAMNHVKVVIAGPFGSSRNNGILIDDRVLVRQGNAIYVYSKSTIERSPVMHFITDKEHALFWMIDTLVSKGKPLKINATSGRVKLNGVITNFDKDDNTIILDDGKMVKLPLAAGQLLTIKTIDGIPTIVNK